MFFFFFFNLPDQPHTFFNKSAAFLSTYRCAEINEEKKWKFKIIQMDFLLALDVLYVIIYHI